ncbi:hypothetical protein D3D02_17240 [Halobellus sp. Atlit-38R]|uniref:hypothetical protein n=1 Tax=Halobellus sp. Atlit-38R TaxID=2282131 RepID=UPI000EF190FE|nr:hypothetical protein [Halobellus sp. Atlit-38R]RLM83675.1 hypothetical protein D3D02_17240 [Halobellus sp. Atlit-38R]
MPIDYPKDADPHCKRAKFIPDKLIQDTLEETAQPHSSQSHELEEIRDLLSHCQHRAVEAWDYWLDSIGRGEGSIAFEDESFIIVDQGQHERPGDHLDTYEGSVDVDESAEDIVTAIHTAMAQVLTHDSWDDSYAYVIRKPPLWQITEEHAVRRIGSLARDRGSVGRGTDAFAVDVYGESQQSWADKTDRTRQAVNNSLKRGNQSAASE